MRLVPLLLVLLLLSAPAGAQVEIDGGPTPPLGGTTLEGLPGGGVTRSDTAAEPDQPEVLPEPVMVPMLPNRVADFLTHEGEFTNVSTGAEGLEAYLDETGLAALQDSLTAYYRYRESGYAHRRAVFDWQLFSSKIIFYVVILLVLLGVYFSWLQFMSEHRRPAKRVEVEVEGAEDERPRGGLLTTFKAGSGGLEVSSPVLGIVILAVSLAFFYLYLTHVYPINEVF